MTELSERPNTIPWPPLLFAGAALFALGLQALLPLPWPGGAWAAVLAMAGLFLGAAGLALVATSSWALWMGLVHDQAPWCVQPP